jgi:hypothetical protein
MKIFISLCCCLFWSSCARIFNAKTTEILVSTSRPAKIAVFSDSLKFIETRGTQNQIRFTVLRSSQPLQLQVSNDSLNRTFYVRSRNSYWYYANFATIHLYGLGYIIDYKSPKRYAYPSSVRLDLTDTMQYYPEIVPYFPLRRGTWRIHYSFPYINAYRFKPPQEDYRSVFGFMGVSLGVDYAYRPNRVIQLTGSGVMSFILPVPAPADFSGEWEWASSAYLNLSHLHKVKNWELGYGLAYGRNRWSWIYYEFGSPPPPTRPEAVKSYSVWGAVVSIHSTVGSKKRGRIGLIYRPTFLQWLEKPTFQYEHLISLDFGINLRAVNGKRNGLK